MHKEVAKFLWWVLRLFIGGASAVIGLMVMGVDVGKLPLWTSFLGIFLISLGFSIMPPLPWKEDPVK